MVPGPFVGPSGLLHQSKRDVMISPHHPESNVLCSLVSSLYYGLGEGVGPSVTQYLLSGAGTVSSKLPLKKGLKASWAWHKCNPPPPVAHIKRVSGKHRQAEPQFIIWKMSIRSEYL